MQHIQFIGESTDVGGLGVDYSMIISDDIGLNYDYLNGSLDTLLNFNWLHHSTCDSMRVIRLGRDE